MTFPKSRRGGGKSRANTVYQLGDHRLICGDATNADHIATLMGKAKADLLITDPPYNVDYTGKTKAALKIANDKMDAGQFLAFLTAALGNAMKHLKAGGAAYIWHADSEGRTFREAAEGAGLPVKQCLIWVKSIMVMGRQDYQWKHEPCLYGWKPGKPHTWNADRKQTTILRAGIEGANVTQHAPGSYTLEVNGTAYHLTGKDIKVQRCHTTTLEFEKPKRSEDHPTMKPVALFEYQIRNSTKPGQNVLDLFAGSGTTVIAAEQAKRRAFVCELDPTYADVIRRRWAEFNHGQGCDWQKLTPAINP